MFTVTWYACAFPGDTSDLNKLHRQEEEEEEIREKLGNEEQRKEEQERKI